VLVAGRQLLRHQAAACQVTAVVDAHARSPARCGIERNLRLDPPRGPEKAHALLLLELHAASEHAVAGRVLQDGGRKDVDAAESRIAFRYGRNADRLLAANPA